MLHFTCGITFRMDVGNFFELEGAFQSDRVVDAAAEIKEIRVAEEQASEFFERGVALQNRFDFMRDASELLHQTLGGGWRQFSAYLRKIQSGEHEGGELAGKCLGRGNSDFRARVGVN